jgi:hypothetical protein
METDSGVSYITVGFIWLTWIDIGCHVVSDTFQRESPHHIQVRRGISDTHQAGK